MKVFSVTIEFEGAKKCCRRQFCTSQMKKIKVHVDFDMLLNRTKNDKTLN